MPSFLLDTDTLSNVVKRALPDFTRWLDQNSGCCFVSVESLHEIYYGLTLLSRSPVPTKRFQGRRLEGLYQVLFQYFPGRFLPNTPVLSRYSGELRALATQRRGDVGVVDAVIGATAIEHNLTVISANMPDFTAMGVAVVHPGGLRPIEGGETTESGLILIRGGEKRLANQGMLPLWPR